MQLNVWHKLCSFSLSCLLTLSRFLHYCAMFEGMQKWPTSFQAESVVNHNVCNSLFSAFEIEQKVLPVAFPQLSPFWR